MQQFLGKLDIRDGLNHAGEPLPPLVNGLYEGDLLTFDLDEDGIMVLHENIQVGWLDKETAEQLLPYLKRRYTLDGVILSVEETGADCPEVELSLFLKDPPADGEAGGTLDSVTRTPVAPVLPGCGAKTPLVLQGLCHFNAGFRHVRDLFRTGKGHHRPYSGHCHAGHGGRVPCMQLVCEPHPAPSSKR